MDHTVQNLSSLPFEGKVAFTFPFELKIAYGPSRDGEPWELADFL